MPPVTARAQPRVVCYHQTHRDPDGAHISVLPLLTEASDVIGITHLILAAIHINHDPELITLNDDPPDDPRNAPLWEEVQTFQDVGVRVLGMLGGAAQGSFARLDQSEAAFERYYRPLRDMIRRHGLDGLDLDVEEEMSLTGIIRLIDRLRADFGPSFIITMSPVATALQGQPHLSGFDYEALEVMRGSSIDFYNVQFYNNWGQLSDLMGYRAILALGWPPEKVVVGVLTNPGNGHGWIPLQELQRTLTALAQYNHRFGGVMGWEYFNSMPGDRQRPWEWAEVMMKTVTLKNSQ
jgi:hypothetical protein